MELPQLVVELVGDYSKLMEDIKRARVEAVKQAQFLEKDLNLTIGVNDTKLSELNKHFDLKVTHFKQTQTYFKNNPLKVFVNDNSLTNLNKELDKLGQRKVTANVSVNGQDRGGGNGNVKVSVDNDGNNREIINSLKSIENAIRSQGKQSLLGRIAGNVFTGFTEEIGRELSLELLKPFNKKIANKIKQGFEVIDREIIGRSQVYETFLAELLSSADLKKASSVALERTKIKKQLNRLNDLQVVANTEEEFKTNKNTPKAIEAVDKILSEEPALMEEFNQRSKKSSLSVDEQKRRFIPTIIEKAQPKEFSQNVILPLVKEFQPFLNFVQGMQAYNTSKLANKYYEEEKPIFPTLQPGQRVVSVMGGAENKMGQGGRAIATSLEPILGSNVKLMPVENLDTDATSRTAFVDDSIKLVIAKVAPELLSSGETLINALRMITHSLNPLGTDVAAAQALAHARLAKEQGNEASAISFSLGGASAYRYAQAAEYEGLDTKTLAMAFPFTNLSNSVPKNFRSTIIDKDPLTFPIKLGANNPTPALSVLNDTGLRTASADIHGVHHLLRSPNFIKELTNVTGVSLPNSKNLVSAQQSGMELQRVLVALKQSQDALDKGEYSLKAFEILANSKHSLAALSKSDMPESVRGAAKEVAVKVEEMLEKVSKFIEEIKLPDGTSIEVPKDFKEPGFVKYTQEVEYINKAIKSFKTGEKDDDAYFAGNLNMADVAERKRTLSIATIPWFEKQTQFGEYGKRAIEGFKIILKLQDEFLRTGGNISKEFLDKVDYLPTSESDRKIIGNANTDDADYWKRPEFFQETLHKEGKLPVGTSMLQEITGNLPSFKPATILPPTYVIGKPYTPTPVSTIPNGYQVIRTNPIAQSISIEEIEVSEKANLAVKSAQELAAKFNANFAKLKSLLKDAEKTGNFAPVIELSAAIKQYGDKARSDIEKLRNSAGIDPNFAKSKESSQLAQAASQISSVQNKAARINTLHGGKGIGENIGAGVTEGLENSIEGLRNAAEKLADTVPDVVTEKLKIQSPSKVMMGYGENTGDGYGIGLENSLDKVKEIAKSGIDDIAKTFDFVSQDPMNPGEELTSSLDDWYLSHRTGFESSKLNNILGNGLIPRPIGVQIDRELELFGRSGAVYSALRHKRYGMDNIKNEAYGAIEFLIDPSRVANKTTWLPQDSSLDRYQSLEEIKEDHRQKGLHFRQLNSVLPKASLMKNYEGNAGYVEAQTHAPVLPSDISAIRIGSSQTSPDQLFKKHGDSLLAFIRTALSKNIKVIGDFSPEFLKVAESAGININKGLSEGIRKSANEPVEAIGEVAHKTVKTTEVLGTVPAPIQQISKKPPLSEAQRALTDEFNKKLAALQGTGKNVGGGLSNGIDNSLKNVKSSSEKLANTVINTVEEKLEIKSPSRWGIRTGQNVGDAMGMGADKSLNKFKTIIASKISEMRKGIEGISPTKFNYTTFPSTSSFPILPTSYKPSKAIPSATGMINGIPDPWTTPAGQGLPNIVSTNQRRVYPISPDPWSPPLSYTIPGTTRSGTSPRLPNISSFPPAYLPPQVPQSISFPISNTTPRGIAPQLPPFLPNGIPQVPQSVINAGAKKNFDIFARLGIVLGKYVGKGFVAGLTFLEDRNIIQNFIKVVDGIKSAVENGDITSTAERFKDRLSRGFSKSLNFVPGFKEAKERFKGYLDFLAEIANPNVSAALGESLANGIVAAKELFVDFLKMPEKIKEGFEQAKVAFDSFVEGMNKVQKFGEMMDFVKSSISNVVKVLALLAVGKIILDLAPASIEVAANFENLERRIKFTSGSISEGAKNIAFLRSEAKRLNVDLSQTLESGSKFFQATKDTPIEGYQSRQIVSAVTQASAVYGLDLDKQQRTFTALEQMSGKTVVSQEELRQQLAEAIPNASQIAANAYGTTTQSMNQLLSTGRVLAEDFLPKFAQQLKAQTSSGVGDAVNSSVAITNKFNNSLIELQESIGKTLLPFRNFSLSAFASGIDLVTKNFQLLKSILLITLIKLGSPVWLMFATYLKGISFSAGGAKGALLGVGQSIATLAAQMFILSMAMKAIDEIMMNFKDNSGAIGEQTRNVTQSINEQRKLLNPSSKVSSDDFSAFRERFTLNPFDNDTKKLKKQMEDSAKRTLEGRENTKKLLTDSNSPAIQKAIRDVQFLDKSLDNIKMERRAIIANDPGNSEALRGLQEWEKKISQMREKPLELFGGNKANLDKQVETLKTYLEYWEELKKNPKLYQSEIEEIDKIIEVTKKDLVTVTKEQDKMTKAIKNSLTEMQKFAIEIRNLEAKFNDLRQSRDTTLSLEKTKLFNLGGNGSIHPGQIEYTNNLKTQENLIGKIADNLKQIQEMSAQLEVNDLDRVLNTLNLNKGSGIDTLKAAQERAIDGSKEKEILSGFIKVKEMQIQTVDMQQQIAEQKYNLTQSLYQQTKQVADYYRAAVRESQAVGIEFEKAQKTLENPCRLLAYKIDLNLVDVVYFLRCQYEDRDISNIYYVKLIYKY